MSRRLGGSARTRRPLAGVRLEDTSAEIDTADVGSRLRLLAEGADEFVAYRFRFVPDLACEYISAGVQAITGYSPADVYADPERLLSAVHPDDVWQLVDLVSEPHTAAGLVTLRWTRADGSIVSTRNRRMPILDDAGRCVGVEGIAYDVSSERRATEGLRRRAELDALTATISRELLSAPPAEMQHAIVEGLAQVARHVGADAATLGRREADGWFRRVQSWYDKAVGPLPAGAPDRLPPEAFPWVFAAIENGRAGVLHHVDELPPGAGLERRMLQEIGAHSAALVSVHAGDDVRGYVSLYWRVAPAAEGAELLSPIRVIGDLLIVADERAAGAAAREEAAALKDRLATIVESSLDAIISTTLDGTIVSWNAGADRMFGYTADEVLGRNASMITPPELAGEVPMALERIRTSEASGYYETQRLRKDGTRFDAAATVSAVHDGAGQVCGAAGIIRDITEQKRAVRERERADARFRSLIEHASDAVIVFDDDGIVRFASPPVRDICGEEPDALIGRHWRDLIHPDDLDQATEVNARLWSETRDPRAVVEFEGRTRHRDGSWPWVEARLMNLTDDEAVNGLVMNVRDISERHMLQHELEHQALHDSLTGLPNRALLMDRLAHALQRAQRDHRSVGLLFLDLDRFKDINDSRGHAAGDELLEQVAQRLGATMRASDTVARFGGDEFVVLLEDDAGTGSVLVAAEKVRKALRQPMALGATDVVVTTSIGVAIADGGRLDAEVLIRDADAAMYRAKDLGRDRYELFDASMHQHAVDQLETSNALRQALPRGELCLFYQPVMRIEPAELLGFETLLRWREPGGRLVPPDEFIPLAEDTGLIVPIGAWVLEEACKQAVAWRMPRQPAPTIAVNVSVRQLLEADFAAVVGDVIARTGIDAASLSLEITETVLMSDADASLDALIALKSLGIRLAIDDFGTGYSSLAYLRRFPVDVLKIDKSFVAGLCLDSGGAAIVSAMLGVARGLGLRVVAEGVETREQLDRLRELGCGAAQGYYFGRPAPPDAWDALLESTSLP